MLILTPCIWGPNNKSVLYSKQGNGKTLSLIVDSSGFFQSKILPLSLMKLWIPGTWAVSDTVQSLILPLWSWRTSQDKVFSKSPVPSWAHRRKRFKQTMVVITPIQPVQKINDATEREEKVDNNWIKHNAESPFYLLHQRNFLATHSAVASCYPLT